MFIIKNKNVPFQHFKRYLVDVKTSLLTQNLAFLVNFEHSLIVIVRLRKVITLTVQVSMLSYFFSLGYNNYQKRQQQQEGGNGGSPRSQRHNFQTQQQQSSGGRMSPQQQNQNQQQGQGQQAGQFQQQKKTSKCHISIELYIICT